MTLESVAAIIAVAALLYFAAIGVMASLDGLAGWKARRDARRRNQAHPWRKGEG